MTTFLVISRCLEEFHIESNQDDQCVGLHVNPDPPPHHTNYLTVTICIENRILGSHTTQNEKSEFSFNSRMHNHNPYTSPTTSSEAQVET